MSSMALFRLSTVLRSAVAPLSRTMASAASSGSGKQTPSGSPSKSAQTSGAQQRTPTESAEGAAYPNQKAQPFSGKAQSQYGSAFKSSEHSAFATGPRASEQKTAPESKTKSRTEQTDRQEQQRRYNDEEDTRGSQRDDAGSRRPNAATLGVAIGALVTVGAAAGTERVRALKIERIERDAARALYNAEIRLRDREQELAAQADQERSARQAAEHNRDEAQREVKELRAIIDAARRAEREKAPTGSRPTAAVHQTSLKSTTPPPARSSTTTRA